MMLRQFSEWRGDPTSKLCHAVIVSYARDYPWIWSLEVSPAYDAIARLKSQEHWQTDVIAGWAIGSAVGYWTTTWKTPISVRMLPGGLSVGFSHRF
jgi:hypothetical protein